MTQEQSKDHQETLHTAENEKTSLLQSAVVALVKDQLNGDAMTSAVAQAVRDAVETQVKQQVDMQLQDIQKHLHNEQTMFTPSTIEPTHVLNATQSIDQILNTNETVLNSNPTVDQMLNTNETIDSIFNSTATMNQTMNTAPTMNQILNPTHALNPMFNAAPIVSTIPAAYTPQANDHLNLNPMIMQNKLAMKPTLQLQEEVLQLSEDEFSNLHGFVGSSLVDSNIHLSPNVCDPNLMMSTFPKQSGLAQSSLVADDLIDKPLTNQKVNSDLAMRLDQEEAKIDIAQFHKRDLSSNQAAFETSVCALSTIIEENLFMARYIDAATYMRERWDLTVTRMRQIVYCAHTLKALKDFGIRPRSERSCRPLVELHRKYGTAILINAWQKILDSGDKLNSGVVANICQKFKNQCDESSSEDALKIKPLVAELPEQLKHQMELFLQSELIPLQSFVHGNGYGSRVMQSKDITGLVLNLAEADKVQSTACLNLLQQDYERVSSTHLFVLMPYDEVLDRSMNGLLVDWACIFLKECALVYKTNKITKKRIRCLENDRFCLIYFGNRIDEFYLNFKEFGIVPGLCFKNFTR